MGPPPIHSQPTAAGLHRMANPAGRSSSRGAACGFWSRTWGHREPSAQGTGRWHSPAQGKARARVGWTFPAPGTRCHSPHGKHPIPTWTRRPGSGTGSEIDRRLLTTRAVSSPQGATRGSSATRTGPWPQRRPHSGWPAGSASPQFMAPHERRCLMAVCRPFPTTVAPRPDRRPMAQLHERASTGSRRDPASRWSALAPGPEGPNRSAGSPYGLGSAQ
jgi:hypothetical protein